MAELAALRALAHVLLRLEHDGLLLLVEAQLLQARLQPLALGGERLGLLALERERAEHLG